MCVTKYILALVVSSLALLTSARLDLAAAQADDSLKAAAKPAVQAKRVAATKQKPKRVIQLDLNAVEKAQLEPVPTPPPAVTQESPAPVKKGPHLDLEGLVIGDMHVQPNVMFQTDTRYDNAATRERAQRDDLDFLAARQHGDPTRSPDPLGALLRTKTPVTPGSPGSNDPGYEVAVAVRDQLYVTPPKPATSAPATTRSTTPATPPSGTPSRTTNRPGSAAKLAKR